MARSQVVAIGWLLLDEPAQNFLDRSSFRRSLRDGRAGAADRAASDVGLVLALSRVMRSPAVSLVLSVVASGCGCPSGNVVVPARDVSFDLQMLAEGTPLTGHGSSLPSGEGISFDRATIGGGAAAGPLAPGDLQLFAMSPGCHPDATGFAVCDRMVRVLLTIHGVTRGAASYSLDDERAELEIAVEAPPGAGPCPGKPGLDGCAATDAGASAPYVAQQGISGLLTMARLAEDCTDTIAGCALDARGTFDVSAQSAGGDTIALASGAVTAADTLSYQDGKTCDR
jgi:hypothetical protein